MKVVILTGDEVRHQYFRIRVANDPRFEVIASYCEGSERSLLNRAREQQNSSRLEIQHLEARSQAEKDFFGGYIDQSGDYSQPRRIAKGDINSANIVAEIIALQPDLLVCYGSSLVKSELLVRFERRFLNVHLGLSPYYRGSGTNVWPLINGDPSMVGATFMYIDEGIDTGEVIHQIRADFFIGDSPHSIGNRFIKKMTSTYCDLIANFSQLELPAQIAEPGLLYSIKDFDADACSKLYGNFKSGMIEDYINNLPDMKPIVKNGALQK